MTGAPHRVAAGRVVVLKDGDTLDPPLSPPVIPDTVLTASARRAAGGVLVRSTVLAQHTLADTLPTAVPGGALLERLAIAHAGRAPRVPPVDLGRVRVEHHADGPRYVLEPGGTA